LSPKTKRTSKSNLPVTQRILHKLFRNAYTILANSIKSLSIAHPNSSLSDSNVTSPFLGILPALTSAEPDPLKESDYPLVTYWHKRDWISSKKSAKGTSDLNAEKPSRGGKRASQGINVTMKYIQDENGTTIDGHRATHMRTIAAGIWGALADAGGAPLTWGKGSLMMREKYNQEMRRRFPEIGLCASDWKAEQIAIDNYPSFHVIRFPDLHKHKKTIRLFLFLSRCHSYSNHLDLHYTHRREA
jgi:hypothetical protein